MDNSIETFKLPVEFENGLPEVPDLEMIPQFDYETNNTNVIKELSTKIDQLTKQIEIDNKQIEEKENMISKLNEQILNITNDNNMLTQKYDEIKNEYEKYVQNNVNNNTDKLTKK